MSITKANTMYMIPRRLWSTEVNQSFQSTLHFLCLVIKAAIYKPTTATTAKVTMMIGS